MTPTEQHGWFHALCTAAGTRRCAVRVSIIERPGRHGLLRIELWDGGKRVVEARAVEAGPDLERQAQWVLGVLNQRRPA